MRRPAPLPSRPERDEPVSAPTRAPRRWAPSGDTRAVGRAGAAASASPSAGPGDVTVPIDPIPFAPVVPAPEDGASGAADGASVTERHPVADGERMLTQRDLWRAARARRRALKAEIKRFTSRSRRRRTIWLGTIGAIVALVGGSVLAAYSPLFAVRDITVVGTSALDADAVAAALDEQKGTPLALIDDSEIKAALVGFPLIETYALEAAPPHGLTVRIVERTPIGVVESPAGFTLVDAAGVVLTTTPEAPEGQPILDIAGGAGSDAFTAAGLVVRSLPADLRSRLTAVNAGSADAVELRLGEVTVMWGSAERSPEKARILDTLVAARPDASRFDVSAPNAVVAG